MDPITIREISLSDAHQVDTLVSRAFSYPGTSRYLDDFPVWNSNAATRLGAFSGTQLVSHAGIRFTSMKTPEGPVPIALIGAVATDPAFRGRGISSLILNEALSRIDQKGAEWTLLWGSEHAFYQKFGFSPQGSQARALISDLLISPRGLASVPVNNGIHPAIFSDLIARKSGISFTQDDRPWVFAHQTVEWFWCDPPFAYVAYQRGLDLKNIIHEHGGDTEGVKRLLFHVFRKNSEAEILGRPAELLALGLEPHQWIEEPLCLARPRAAGMKWNPSFWVSGIAAC
jgi:predicted N-acetyltransferase YhbS